MTLAATLFHVFLALSLLRPATGLCESSSAATKSSATAVQEQSNSQPQGSTASTTTQTAPAQSSTAPPGQSESSSSGPAKKPAGAARPAAQHSGNKKKAGSSNCDSTVTGGSATPGPEAASGNAAQSGKTPSAADAGASQAGSQTAASTNCPPKKVTVVREGSTAEPSIQVVGGADHSGDTAKFLQSTDENLKKLAGRQLDSSQQSMVAQVHQFIEQSKTATAAGDLESARTLAWKAQLLSDELVNPQK
jgi:hypothetical protein